MTEDTQQTLYDEDRNPILIDREMALQKAPQSADLWLHPLEPYAPVKALRELARRIMALDHGKVPMNAKEASLLAETAITTQLNPFAQEIWGWVVVKGDRRFLTIMPGRKGLLRHAHEQAEQRGFEFTPEYIDIIDAEQKQHWGYGPDDMVCECRVYDTKSTDEWGQSIERLGKIGIEGERAIDLAGERPYVSGIGILTAEERDEFDKYGKNAFRHIERLHKRALSSCLKQKFTLPFGGGTSSASAAEFEDFVYSPPPRLSEESAIVDAEFSEEAMNDPFGLDPEDKPTDDEVLRKRRRPDFWEPEILKAVMEAGFAENEFQVAARLAYSQLSSKIKPALATIWVGIYQGVKNQIAKSDEEWSAQQIAEAADALYVGMPGEHVSRFGDLREKVEKKPKVKKKTAKKKTGTKKKPKKKAELESR